MRRFLRVLSVTSAVLSAVLLTACSPPAAPSAPSSRTGSAGSAGSADSAAVANVDVDTPALRALKAQARVAPCAPGAPGEARSELPAVALPCLGGGPRVDLSRLRGPMVINLFAQWCGPCRDELPYYQALHEKAGGRLRVLGVDYLDPQPDGALELVRRTGVTFPLVADPAGTLRRDLRVRGLPGIVLLGRDGSVRVEYRVFRSYAELRGVVQERLGVALPT